MWLGKGDIETDDRILAAEPSISLIPTVGFHIAERWLTVVVCGFCGIDFAGVNLPDLVIG